MTDQELFLETLRDLRQRLSDGGEYVTCDPGKLDAVFEIPVTELRPERFRTAISVDLAEPGATAIFDDAIPWIMLTFYERQR